jgi:large subunit ribosomal protein L24
MSIAKIQSGDKVKIIAGNYRGVTGVVTKVIAKKQRNGLIIKRASVSGVEKITKYRKSQTFQGQKYPGQRFDTDRFIDLSSISLVDGDQISKAKITMIEGKKVRVYKKTDNSVKKSAIPEAVSADKLSTLTSSKK